MASTMLSPWMSWRARSPSPFLTFLSASGSRSRTTSLSLNVTPNTYSALVHCTFLCSPSSLSFPSSLSGLSLGLDLTSNVGVRRRKGCGLVVRAGKAALCQTKRNRSRKSLAHKWKSIRMRTTSGRAVLKRRGAKGCKVLCTKSNPILANSGRRA